MPEKSRKSAQARYQRRKAAARQKLVERTNIPVQPAATESTSKVAVASAAQVASPATSRFSVGNELRKIGLLGGGLIAVLIIVSIILRYTFNNP